MLGAAWLLVLCKAYCILALCFPKASQTDTLQSENVSVTCSSNAGLINIKLEE